jgi:WD40 repeat protein
VGRALAGIFLVIADPAAAATVDYEKQLLPLLKDNCLPCHNKTTTKGGLNMETVDLMLKGGDNGPSIIRGDGAKSLLQQAAAGEWDSEMPPKNNKVSAVPFTSGQLALLKQWIDEGAHHAGKQERVIAWEPLPAGFTPIYATTITRDARFAAAARGNQVSVYHLPTARLMTRLTDAALIQSGLYQKPGVAHRDVVPALAFSPDGSHLITGSFREVKIWRLAPAAPPAVPAQAPASPSKFKLSPAGPDAVALRDAADGKTLREFKHGAAITAFILSADGQKVATAGADHKLKLWETATGAIIREIIGDASTGSQLSDAIFAADRAALETAWQTESVKKTEKEVTDLNARLTKSKELETAAQKTLEDKRKDAEAKTEAKAQADAALKALESPPAPAPAAKNEAVPAPAKPDEAANRKLADARETAAKADTEAQAAREALKRAETAVQDAAQEIKHVSGLITAGGAAVKAAKAALEKSQRDLETAAAAKAAAVKRHAEAIHGVHSLVFSPDGAQVAALDASNQLRVWSADTGLAISASPLKPALAWPDARGPILSAAVPESDADPARMQWKLERTLGTGDAKSPITDRVNALAFSPDGKTLAVGSGEPSRSGDITLWSLADGALKARWDDVHLDSVLALDFSPDGKHLASGGADKALRVLDTASGKVLKVFEGHTHHVLGVSWRADGRVLASAGADAVVKIWDWTTGERRQNLTGWEREVTAVRYLGATDILATCSGDAKVRMLTSAGVEVKSLTGARDFLNSLAATKQGEWLLTGGQEGRLQVWQAPAAEGIVLDLGAVP